MTTSRSCGRRGFSRGAWIAGAWLLFSVWSRAASAETLCGRVENGGHPIDGASVLAADEGLVAYTDSTGLFCFTNLRGKAQRLQILAFGFAPVERFLAAGRETLLVELIPLRTLSTANVAPAKRSRLGWDLTEEIPMLDLPSDPPHSSFGNSLSALVLAEVSDSAYADSVTRRGSWRRFAETVVQARSLDCRGPDSLGGACSPLLRVEAVAWARAAVVGGDEDASRRARAALARVRAEQSDPDAGAWADRIEALLPH